MEGRKQINIQTRRPLWAGLFILSFLGLSTKLQAQNNFQFDRITIDNGLSNTSINAILQTADGFLWIATKDGLNRFDGQGFKVYKFNPVESGSLPENYVMSLLEDHAGRLWVGTWGGGLCRYDSEYDIFISYHQEGSKDEFVQSILEDFAGNIWYGTTEGGLFCVNPANDQSCSWSSWHSDYPLNAVNISSLAIGPDGRIWLGTWGEGLICLDTENSRSVIYNTGAGKGQEISSDYMRHILNDGDSLLIISTLKGVNVLDFSTGIVRSKRLLEEQYPYLASHNVGCSFRDSKNRIWIGSYDYYGLGLILPAKAGKQQTRVFVNEDDNPYSLTIDRIRCIYEDKKSNLWIGTENGLNKLPFYQPFRQYRHLPLRENSIGGRVVSGFCSTEDDILWVGYGGGGFDRIDLKTEEIKHFHARLGSLNSLSNDDVTSMYAAKDGTLWITTMNGGLNRFTPKTEKFKSYKADGNVNSIPTNWAQQVLETSEGIFLVGTNSGLMAFDRDKEVFTPFEPRTDDQRIILPAQVSVNALFEDSQKRIWIGTWLDGLYCYYPSRRILTHYLPDPEKKSSISSNKITTIFEDSRKQLWFGTHSGGICTLDEASGEFHLITTIEGLPNDVVFGIQEDGSGSLWISTLRGLARLTVEDGNIRIYDQLDGLVNNQFNWRASYKLKDGRILFGGTNGFISFHPEEIRTDSSPPQVAITSFKVFNKETALHQSLPASRGLELAHNQNFFSVEFTALDMAPSQKHLYMYMLEGIDPDWVEAGTRTTAFYTDIRHGDFRFLVKACNADGAWSNPVALEINILPAWWNRWWVKILGLSSIFGIGILVARLRFWHLLEIERIRLNIARDLHDEMGSNLSSISVDSQQLMRSAKMELNDRELATDIYKTTNETIDSIRDIIWFINPKNDGGENLIYKMRERAATMLAGKNWTFTTSDDLRLDSLKLEIRRNIFLIFKETLTNVIRHSEASSCDIKMHKAGTNLIFEICDNGRGFNIPDTKKQGGLQNIYHRAEKIGAEISLTSETGVGTCLTLRLSVAKHLS